MKYNVFEILVGFAILALASTLGLYAYHFQNPPMKDIKTYTASFDRIDGLLTGNDVKMSGVKVGIVDTVDINPNTYRATIRIKIRGNINLPDDTMAEVASESLMGGKYIALVPGGSSDFLKDHGAITYTQSSLSFEGLLGKYLLGNKAVSNPQG